MQITNEVHRLRPLPAETWLSRIALPLATALGRNAYPLRFAIVDVARDEVVVESTVIHYSDAERYAATLGTIELLEPRRKTFSSAPFVAVQIVPTGVRCEFGGFAGDACPVTNLLAAAADVLVTHPNAVNASELNEMAANVLYVEGKALDDLLLGHIALAPPVANCVGTFVDPTGLEYLDDVIHVLNAAMAVGGIACEPYTVLDDELGVQIDWSESGCAVGVVRRPETILDGVQLLIARGAEAIGGVSVIHGVTKEMFAKHLNGEIPNPSGGVEAIITHLISKVLRVPTAHAPLPYYRGLKHADTINPRTAAEFISTPHYYCVLKGLAKAPRLVSIESLERCPAQLITVNNIGAVIVPASCLGGIPALAAEYSGIPIVAVRENATVLNVTNRHMHMRNVIEVDSYLQAAGVILALRKGIALPSLMRPIQGARRVGRSRVTDE